MTDIRDEISLEAAGSDAFSLEAFARVYAKYLEDAEQVFDLNVEVLSCRGPRGKKLELLGYAEDETDQTLTVLAGKYFGSDETLTLGDAKDALSRARGFIESSIDGWLSNNLEISSREAEYAAYFASKFERNQVSKIRIILITDGFMSDRIRTLESETLVGKKVVYEVWDQKRVLESELPELGSEDIHVDFKRWLPLGLPCLVADTNDLATQTYLAVIPANILFAIFEEFGSLLLESNVRTFLSARGAVNKGIQSTLAQEPNRFLAYNNGLTTTATKVDIEKTDMGFSIVGMDRWQIVNGGQTTASIAHFLRGDRNRNVDSVHVQMKLVKVTDSDSASVVQAVAKYANSQNRVSGADLFATHEFHVRLEQISRRLKAPTKEGEQYRSAWYYERARGQWEYEKVSQTTAKELKKFELEFPRSQKITKTDWARFSYCWGKKPYLVSKGAQSVFAEYAVAVDKEWENDDSRFNENYFKTNISKAIMYEALRSAVLREEWYTSSQGYLANIVAYAISKFALEIEKQKHGSKYNFEQVWNQQSLPEATLAELLLLSRAAQVFLTSPSRPQANVTQWAKQQACWDGFSKVTHTLSDALDNDLVDSEVVFTQERDAKKTRKMDAEFEDISRVIAVSRQTWGSVASAISQVPISPMETSLISEFGSGIGKVPSDRQARALLRMLDRFRQAGVITDSEY
jgi:hypothetical protein